MIMQRQELSSDSTERAKSSGKQLQLAEAGYSFEQEEPPPQIILSCALRIDSTTFDHIQPGLSDSIS